MSLVSEGMFTLEVSKCFEEAYVCRNKEGALLIMWLVQALLREGDY